MYTTLEKVKEENPDTTLTDNQINAYISFVSRYIDTYIGYKLAVPASTPTKDIFVDGSGTEHIVLNKPINGFTTLERVQGVSNVVQAETIVSYPLNSPYTEYLGTRSGKFYAGMANYVLKDVREGRYLIDFTPASVTHTLPEDITQVTTSLTSEIVKNNLIQANAMNTGLVTSETTGSYSVSYATPTKELLESFMETTPNVSSVLKSYKQVNIV